ncbi:hypothetical protein GCM10010329_52590 [Streptomyces spiroverticillatus]|uniref:DUF1963 domain-containing protein n=1 Tax=Streptomyces finlayi TaxID=67296 RepID=A0A918X1X5_9ACTN|nr:hypothetical protein [Streptomyces finlayi]GHA22703.1 hypothetical protein GCM10010329_52590 [Streptomyces spiroverticillatus]GHD04558.1 hypothetical protein GCM10010334_53530 [Streptomyces finlayi]
MSRTTPPRPVDITTLFPELAPLARTAIRLHPRAGAPSVTESSVGGPLLWPTGEEWPTCAEHGGPWRLGLPPEDVRQSRRMLAEAWARTRADDADLLSKEERETLDRLDAERRIPVTGPMPMLPVAQVYAADVPRLPYPEGTDLLQVLWCPFDHADDGYVPRTALRWRAAADVTDPVPPGSVPQPPVVDSGDYLPEPCVLHPEEVTEYPAPHVLPEELAGRIEAWDEEQEGEAGEPDGMCYQSDLAVAPGFKALGHEPWSFSDPFDMACPACGSGVRPLLTVDGSEWGRDCDSWRPVEDATYTGLHFLGPASATQLTIGRGYNLQLYVCADDPRHPHLQNMQ